MKSGDFPLPNDWRFLMTKVNTEVNALPYKADSVRWGQAEYWEVADKDGEDCDGFALAKLRRLLVLGFPIQRLRLATCFIGADGGRAQGEGHAVLVVEGAHEQYVLSNGLEPMAYPAFVSTGWMRDKIQMIGGSPNWVPWKAT